MVHECYFWSAENDRPWYQGLRKTRLDNRGKGTLFSISHRLPFLDSVSDVIYNIPYFMSQGLFANGHEANGAKSVLTPRFANTIRVWMALLCDTFCCTSWTGIVYAGSLAQGSGAGVWRKPLGTFWRPFLLSAMALFTLLAPSLSRCKRIKYSFAGNGMWRCPSEEGPITKQKEAGIIAAWMDLAFWFFILFIS